MSTLLDRIIDEEAERQAEAARRELNVFNSRSHVRARILWPALGFPEVIHPAGHTPVPNPTSRLHLLIATGRKPLTPRDVALHLRYVPWKQRRERFSKPQPGVNSFAASDIEVMEISPTAANTLAEQVRFGDGYVVANLSKRVRQFYKQNQMPYLYAVSVSETASAALPPDSQLNLYWISENKNATEKDISDEMKLLVGQYAPARCDKELGLRSEWPEAEVDALCKSMLGEYEYDYGLPQTPQNRTEVLHPLFVRTPGDRIEIAHLTDVHCDTRHQVYQRNLQGHPALTNFNNWNETFSELYQKAQQSDAILLTGDLIEYGRGHIERLTSLGDNYGYWCDRNWFVFYRLTASEDVGFRTPMYTTLGNHDWRINPYGPKAPGAPSPDDFNLPEPEDLVVAHGPDRRPVGKPVLGIDEAEETAIVTDEDSVDWYCLLINPFFDYIVQYPGPVSASTREPSRYSFLMLDWAKDEETMRRGFLGSRFQFFSTYEKVLDESTPAGGLILARGAPWAAGAISDLQKELTWWFLTQERTAKVVAAHFPVLGPRPSWPQEAMQAGLIDPCPLCLGRGKRREKGPAREQGEVDCACTKAFKQEPNRRTRHPIVALGNPGGLSEEDLFKVQPRWGSLVQNRDWFIKALLDSDTSVVLSGHIHRDGAFIVRQPDQSGDGRGTHESYLRGAKVGERAGVAVAVPDDRLEKFDLQGIASRKEQRPVIVNTVCGGPHAKFKKSAGTMTPTDSKEIHLKINKGKTRGIERVPPGYRTIRMRPNGAIDSIQKIRSTRVPLIDIPRMDIIGWEKPKNG